MDKLGIVLDVPVTVNLSKQLHSIKDGNLTRVQVLEYTKQTLESIMSKDVTIAAAQEPAASIQFSASAQNAARMLWKQSLPMHVPGKALTGNDAQSQSGRRTSSLKRSAKK